MLHPTNQHRTVRARAPVDYDIYGMSRAAWLLQRDRADWEFAKDRGLPPLFCTTYEDALRHQAGVIIGKGLQ